MTSVWQRQAVFWYPSRSKFELLYLLSNLAEIWHMHQFYGIDIEFELKKIRYRYDLSKRKAISYENLPILAKHSLT